MLDLQSKTEHSKFQTEISSKITKEKVKWQKHVGKLLKCKLKL